MGLHDFATSGLRKDMGKSTQFQKSMIIFNVVLIIKNKHIEEMIRSVNDILTPKTSALEEVSYTTLIFNFLQQVENPFWYVIEFSIVWCLSYVLRKTVLKVHESKEKPEKTERTPAEKVFHCAFWACIMAGSKPPGG